jgi:hypothetical protein
MKDSDVMIKIVIGLQRDGTMLLHQYYSPEVPASLQQTFARGLLSRLESLYGEKAIEPLERE